MLHDLHGGARALGELDSPGGTLSGSWSAAASRASLFRQKEAQWTSVGTLPLGFSVMMQHMLPRPSLARQARAQ